MIFAFRIQKIIRLRDGGVSRPSTLTTPDQPYCDACGMVNNRKISRNNNKNNTFCLEYFSPSSVFYIHDEMTNRRRKFTTDKLH